MEASRPDDRSAYAASWLQRADERRRERAARAAALRQRLVAAMAAFVREFGPRRVVLFGSVVRGEPDSHSDVDLLIYGLSAERYFDAAAALERALRDAPCDLVPAERCSEAVRCRAEAEGEALYG